MNCYAIQAKMSLHHIPRLDKSNGCGFLSGRKFGKLESKYPFYWQPHGWIAVKQQQYRNMYTLKTHKTKNKHNDITVRYLTRIANFNLEGPLCQ